MRILFYMLLITIIVPHPSVAQNLMPASKPVHKTEKADSETVDEATETIQQRNYIGEIDTIRADFEDTLLHIGRDHNLGYVEMVAANPGVDPWLPGRGTKIILPKKHLIPNVPREGIVINLAEMRMYDFVTDPANPKTYPLGVGREGLNTPTGVTTIVRKKDGPSWRPTPRMRKENPELPEVVPPGDENPLGTHALYLGWPQYLIHGTNKPYGVGRRVSSGCIRMYPEDIVKVFENIPVGTKVRVIKEPIKMAWIDDMLYIEAHAEDELADSYEYDGKIKEYRVPETLFKDLSDIAGDASDRLDWAKIRDAVKYRQGVPVAILKSKPNDTEITEDILKIDEIETPPRPFTTHRFNS
jgi:L,D-transpeptidase ErfK/SrfK